MALQFYCIYFNLYFNNKTVYKSDKYNSRNAQQNKIKKNLTVKFTWELLSDIDTIFTILMVVFINSQSLAISINRNTTRKQHIFLCSYCWSLRKWYEDVLSLISVFYHIKRALRLRNILLKYSVAETQSQIVEFPI